MSLRRAWRGGWVTALVTACWTGGGNATAPAAKLSLAEKHALRGLLGEDDAGAA